VELSGRSVLLTGATGGIGRAAALRLAKRGARLALFARSEGPLQALSHEIASLGGEAIGISGDIRVPADAARAIREVEGRFGGLDALVNAAGIGKLVRPDEGSDAEIEEQIEVNLMGVIRMTRAALPALLRRSGTAIVNVASFAGRVGAPHYSYYAASKFGVVGLTECWRRELKARGIRVTLLTPAAVETPLLDRADRARAIGIGPAGTILEPEDVARAVERALRAHPPEIYLPGRNYWLALVNVAFPGLSDRIVTSLFRYPRG
jgi:3-oxoacyl-[acyl-carrier protein] reductase